MFRIVREALRWVAQRLNIVAYLTAENLVLRKQLIVLRRTRKRPELKDCDRLFWVVVSRTWPGWRDALVIVQPDNVVGVTRGVFVEG